MDYIMCPFVSSLCKSLVKPCVIVGMSMYNGMFIYNNVGNNKVETSVMNTAVLGDLLTA